MSNLCFSQMIIDDSELELNTKVKNQRINNLATIGPSPMKIDINRKNLNETIDEKYFKSLFPYLNEEV